MRNLKRVLALALALVMMLGMMITANAATYADEAAIAPEYADAVEILTGMGVFQGTGAGFAPKATLSRAEAAALIYRVITADVDDAKIDLYDYSSFDDVEAGKWYTGYITYAANGGYLKGYDGKAMPNDKVTGVQVLAIMLRAAGYGQNGEYEGAAWMDNILTDAQDLGLLAGVNVKSLAVPATREIVAQLIFNAMTKARIVTYTPALGYIPVNLVTLGQTQLVQTLAVKNFNLDYVETSDDWGRPVTKWFDASVGLPFGLYAVIEEIPVATYSVAVSECQIASDLGYTDNASTPVNTFVNNNSASTAVNPVNVRSMVGAQGRVLEVYKNIFGTAEDRIVMVDTFLAQVDKVVPATYDVASHQITPAKLYLTVYDAVGGQTKVVETNAKADYTYSVGDMLLVNAQTYEPATHNTVDLSVAAGRDGYAVAKQIEIVGYATSTIGAQSYVYSDNSRTVGGVKYPSNVEFNYDATNKVVSTTNYTWYFDQFGNLIGAFPIATIYNYGVIENIQWINPELTTGYALATIRYMDNTTANVKVASLNSYGLTYATTGDTVGTVVNGKWIVSTSTAENKAVYFGSALYAIEDKGNNTVALNAVALTAATTEGRTSGNITTGVSVVGGIPTDNATIYMVRTTDLRGNYVYTYYTGYASIPTITGASVVDYVMNVRTGYAKYVYVIGEPDAALTGNVVHIKALTWFYDNNTTNYTLTSAYVNGVETPVVVDSATFATLAANTVYKMNYTNGVATSATAITNSSWTTVNSVKNQVAKVLTVTSVSGTDVVKTNDNIEWNVVATPVYGGEMKVGSTIVVTAVAGTTTADAIYVIAE